MGNITLRKGAFRYAHSLTEHPEDNQHHMYSGNSYQLFYLLSGDVVYQVEDKMLPLSPGDLVLINNKELHRPFFSSDKPYERILIFFTAEFCSHYQISEFSITRLFENRKPGSFNHLPQKYVEEAGGPALLNEMEGHIDQKLPESPLLVELTFVRLLIQLNATVIRNKDILTVDYDYHEKVEQIVAYLNTHLDQPLTLEFVERTFFISRFYFSHLFKKITGTSFKDYLLRKRVAKACELLTLAVPAVEVARQTGFADYSNFYRAFHRITGTAPSHYHQPRKWLPLGPG